MPANLPPEYIEAERRFRDAQTPGEKGDVLEEMLKILPKHKGTDKLRADLRRRISKLRDQAVRKKGAARKQGAYDIDREGAAQVAIVGAPNTGKSSLLSVLTNATPEVAAFPHTTWGPTPGMAPFENIQFQLIDTPPLSPDYVDPGLLDLVRRVDMVLLLVDLQAKPLDQLEETLALLAEGNIYAEEVGPPAGLRKPPSVKKMLLVAGKMDGEEDEEVLELFLDISKTALPCLGISVRTGRHLDDLLQRIYSGCRLIRVYSQAPGKAPDRSSPFVMPLESTLEDLAERIHKDFKEDLKYARAWGRNVHDGQMIQRDYVLQDGDVVEIHT